MKHLHLEFQDDRAVVTFDREGSRANLLDGEVFAELDEVLDQVERERPAGGLLFRSTKPTVFIAGADLQVLKRARGDELRALIRQGQGTFNRISGLPFPVVAAIHGACVGGGYELALACDWRVASDSGSTKIGLPETSLGILPAWGGTARLCRLIGLPRALGLILGGKILPVGGAKAQGLIDAVVPQEHLDRSASSYLSRGKRRPRQRPWLHHVLSRRLIGWKVGKRLAAKTRGNYPALDEALEVAVRSTGEAFDVALRLEEEAVIRLSERPETEQLMRLYFLREEAKKRSPNGAEASEIRRSGVIGAGVMGAGIAYWLSARQREVLLRDVDREALARGMASIAEAYEDSKRRHILSAVEAARGLDRVVPMAEEVMLGRCDLVIEAAVEKMEVKLAIFRDLSARVRGDAIIATNTSALSVEEISRAVENPGRVIGLHFFYPVHRMPLVEVIRTGSTTDEVLATAVAFVQSIGKTPIVVRDSPGFLVNRILMPYLVEAAALFGRGADPVEIDEAMLDFGMPMGPLRLLDEVGLDVALHVAGTLAEAFPGRMAVPGLVAGLVEQGHLGRKTGSGFFQYGKGEKGGNPAALGLRRESGVEVGGIAEGLAGLMAAEARLCLEEGIVGSADEIDLAMVLGTGYAPFRGGPMQNERGNKT